MNASGDTALRRYASLGEALRDKRYPLENHAHIKRFTSVVGIEGFYETTGYIRAVRADGGPDLRIYYGGTNGFVSEEEVIRAAGDETPRGPSITRKGLWRIGHPTGAPGRDAGARRSLAREYGTCPRCFTKFSASGTCGCTD
ncbi:hypothetical protein [Agromyces mariniharenae]|uniref:Uncharacterized protein n=1 Tax=Agromyces mariniharenae TaxID=2604423 RepID=A0A5S4V8H8_9MICO|nr:hypothetical protein [Agromyces mariniharenae]TYL50415.1 hypothetical protein FYC51_14505 [Agromyces mariniharenae]